MTSQIFKQVIPNETLIELLENIAVKTEKCYVINNNSYKKGMFDNTINNFIENCKPYYHLSKRKYLERKLTYNSFMTIIRQICNSNKITYTSQIKYDKSTYDIMYYIYFW
jgi:lysyl-tRNA synthetase class I